MYLSRPLGKYLAEFEQKARKHEDIYQMSGNNSSMKTKEKYEDLAEICRVAMRAEEEEDA